MAAFLLVDEFDRGVSAGWMAGASTSAAAGLGLAYGCGMNDQRRVLSIAGLVAMAAAMFAMSYVFWSSHLGRFFFWNAFWCAGVAGSVIQLLVYGPPPPQVEEGVEAVARELTSQSVESGVPRHAPAGQDPRDPRHPPRHRRRH